MDKWLNEISSFDAVEGDYGQWELVVNFRHGASIPVGSLAPEQAEIVTHTLHVLGTPGPQDEMGQLAAALTRKISAHKIAPEGMAFPVGLYSQPVPQDVAHLWHNADGTIRPAAPNADGPAQGDDDAH